MQHPPRRPSPGGRWAPRRALLPLGFLALAAGTALGQDPFAPGLRWSRAAGTSDAWLPRSVAFAAGDEQVWCAALGTATHVELDGVHGAGPVPALARDDGVAQALTVLSVAAGRDPDALFTVAQFPQPDATHRRTVVMRYATSSAAAGGPFAPVWSHDPGWIVNGPARIACDERGKLVFFALWSDTTQTVRLDVLDGATGTLQGSTTFAATNLTEVAVAAGGTRVAVTAGSLLWIGDALANALHVAPLASSTRAVSWSGDGALLAVGGIAELRVLAEGPTGYANAFQVVGPGNELAARAELARDGSTLAIGWWNYTNGVDLRLEVVDVPTRARVWQLLQPGTPGGLQNVPEAVRVSPDGRRIALGAWGNGSSVPELMLFDRASPVPVLAANLPGSVLALALDASGTRVAVGLKSVHANQFAGTGEVRLYDTGERDLVVRGLPVVGGTLELSARRAGATDVLFLIGPLAPQPVTIPGTLGELALRRTRLVIHPAVPDGTGRADFTFPLPNDPLWHNRVLHWQAAFRVGGVLRFSESVVSPLVW